MSCLVLSRNLADGVTPTSSLGMQGDRVLTEMQKPFMAGLARTEGTNDPWVLTYDFGSQVLVDAVAMYGVNIYAGASGGYDIGMTGGSVTATDDDYGHISALFSGNDDNPLNNEWVFVLPEPTPLQYLQITMQWNMLAPIDYFDARRLCVWQGLRLRTASIESGFDVVERGSAIRSRGERVFSSPRKPHKLHTIVLKGLTQAQAIGDLDGGGTANLQQVLASVGQSREIAIYPTTADQHRIHRLGCYGHLEQSSRIRPLGRGLYAAELQIRQAPA